MLSAPKLVKIISLFPMHKTTSISPSCLSPGNYQPPTTLIFPRTNIKISAQVSIIPKTASRKTNIRNSLTKFRSPFKVYFGRLVLIICLAKITSKLETQWQNHPTSLRSWRGSPPRSWCMRIPPCMALENMMNSSWLMLRVLCLSFRLVFS